MCLSALHYINLVQQYTAVQTPTLSGGSINRGRKCISGGGVYPYIYIFCVTLKIAQPPPTNFLNCFFFSAAGRVQAPMYDSDASMDRSRRDVPKAVIFVVGCAPPCSINRRKSALKYLVHFSGVLRAYLVCVTVQNTVSKYKARRTRRGHTI